MINEAGLSDSFWREVICTVVYILNRGQIITNSDKTPYELWKWGRTFVKHFRIFVRKCYIKRDDEDLGKFDFRSDEGIFLGHSSKNKSYRSYNKRMQKIFESINVIIAEEIKYNKEEEDEHEEKKQEKEQ
jgi:hypothetical protein